MSPVPRPARRCTHPGCTRDQTENHRCPMHAAAYAEQQKAKDRKRLAVVHAGRSKTDRRKRYGAAWQRQRQRILHRDDWTCQACGNTDGRLHVHHTLDTSTPHDDELVTLCSRCHAALHRGDTHTITRLRRAGWGA